MKKETAATKIFEKKKQQQPKSSRSVAAASQKRREEEEEKKRTVMNQVDFVRAYVLEVMNGVDLDGIIGPSKILESFIWDPGPIINQLNRIRD